MSKQKARESGKEPASPTQRGEEAAALEPLGKRKERRRFAIGDMLTVRRSKRPGKNKVKLVEQTSRKQGKAADLQPAVPTKVAAAVHKLARRPLKIGRLERLELAIEEVRHGGRASPRTRKLQTMGIPKMAQKVIEEAGEVAIEALQANKAALVNETVDLFYNVMVLLSASGVAIEEVWSEMDRRELTLGMAEKMPKLPDLE